MPGITGNRWINYEIYLTVNLIIEKVLLIIIIYYMLKRFASTWVKN